MDNTIMDNVICKTQQRIYARAAKTGYDMESFSNAFLKSGFCKRAFDTIYSRFQNEDAAECFDFLIPEISGQVKIGTMRNNAFSEDIGYMYRLLYIMTSVPSADLADIILYSEMEAIAPRFDHYGFEECAKEIIQKHNLQVKRYDNNAKLMPREEMQKFEENLIFDKCSEI